MQKNTGFSMLEMVVVIAIIAILALIALPDFSMAAVRKQIKDSGALMEVAKSGVMRSYALTGQMPTNNMEAGVPEPIKLVGTHVTGIEVKNGAVIVTFGNTVNDAIRNRKLTLRPAFVEGQPAVPISWVCSQGRVPVGMTLAGIDETDFPDKFTPIECRKPETPK